MSNTDPKNNIQIQSLEPYRHLFPACPSIDHTVKKGASVSDTVGFIPAIVRRDSWHVRKYVDQELRGLTTYEACKKLWQFIYDHIAYKKDERGAEQVRSGRRLIADGTGDCDCYTTFIDKCLYELKIPFINRITKYSSSSFQHIYPIVPIGSGKYIVMDCVVDNFNYEQPYTEKEDHAMDLQYLDGIDDTPTALVGIDARDLFGYEDQIGELGKLLKKNRGGGGAPKKGIFKKKTPEQKKANKQKRQVKRTARRKKILKVVNKVNKINPATVLLRGGILASMKLNLMKVAENLKWGYATKDYAVSKGIDPVKYDKLKKVLTKAEKIFYAAGGKPENLKKSILTGKGNKNHEVSGLDDLGDYSTMPELLGAIYADEFVNGLEGLGEFGELGEPATAAAITAASGAMGTLAILIKSIGGLFPNKGKRKKGAADEQGPEQSADNGGGSEEAPASEEAPSEPIPEDQTDPASSPGDGPDEPEPETPADESVENAPSNESEENNEVAPSDEPGEPSGEEAEQPQEEGTSGILNGPGLGIKALFAKYKWLMPVSIGVGVLAIAGIVAYATTSNENKHKRGQPALNGPGKKNRKKWKGGHGKYEKKSLMALQ